MSTEQNDPKLDPRWGEPNKTHDPYLLASFQARATDVIITTAPKAGTTWMQQILHQIRSKGDETFASIFEVVPWLELPKPNKSTQQVLAEYERIPNPRIFKTHCIYPQTPGTDIAKIILTSRDPRDCCISFYHHVMDFSDHGLEYFSVSQPESFAIFFEQWIEMGSWFRNVQSWWPHKDDANVLWLRYKDMIQDLPASIDRIYSFLGWPLAEETRSRVIEYSSFNWMKANRVKFTRFSADSPSIFKPRGFIRKGQVGDYKSLLSPEQEQRILNRARQDLDPECLQFLGIPQD